MSTRPDLDDVKTYLGTIGTAAGKSDDQIQQALTAEIADQNARCRIPTDPDAFPAALAEALRRRVARNLAMRAIPLGVQTDAELGGLRLGSKDPEVLRLEAPHRKRVVG